MFLRAFAGIGAGRSGLSLMEGGCVVDTSLRSRNNRRGFAALPCENRSHRSLPSTQRASHDHPHHDRIHRARGRSHR
ncbi:hypothetical protein CRM91_24480 [Burkholderia ambifaria]|nr:hypothetical protein CRM91_24480 [Burkholderia ambifaria]